MAILRFQASHDISRPGGSAKSLPPREAMILRGPCIQASVSISSAFATQLLAKGLPIPPPIVGPALIDTGAGLTCIDESKASAAGFPIIDMMNVSSASHAVSVKPVFPIQIELLGSTIKADVNRAVGGELSAQGILVLIGRDFLADCVLIYDGSAGTTTLLK
jgi:predicted aspartyl protease